MISFQDITGHNQDESPRDLTVGVSSRFGPQSVWETHDFTVGFYSDKKGKGSKLTQPCPSCGFPIGIIAGSKKAICRNCGFKDPCCE